MIKSLQDSAPTGHVASDSNVVRYFFFDFSDVKKQSLDGMLRSLIWQLYYHRTDARQFLESLYARNGAGRTQPSTRELAAVLSSMTKSNVQVILDALDECQDRRKLLPWIQDLASLPGLRLILTSRMENDIEVALGKWVTAGDVLPIQNDLVGKDIRVYLKHRIQNVPGFERWLRRKDVQDDIVEKLMPKVNGM